MKKWKWYALPALPTLLIVAVAAALTALLSLEATMLQRFGDAEDGIFRGVMIGISGLVVSLILLSMSITMIVHATRKIKQMGEHENE